MLLDSRQWISVLAFRSLIIFDKSFNVLVLCGLAFSRAHFRIKSNRLLTYLLRCPFLILRSSAANVFKGFSITRVASAATSFCKAVICPFTLAASICEWCWAAVLIAFLNISHQFGWRLSGLLKWAHTSLICRERAFWPICEVLSLQRELCPALQGW